MHFVKNLQAEGNRRDINNGYLFVHRVLSFLIKTADKNLESIGLLLAVSLPGKSPAKTLGSITSHLLAVVPEKLGGTQT